MSFSLHFLKNQPSSRQIKASLVVLASLIIGVVLFYTQVLVNQMRNQEKITIAFYADLLNYYTTQQSGDEIFFLEKILPTINFSLISADANSEPMFPYNANILNIRLDTTASIDEQRLFLKKYIAEMAEIHDPIIIKDSQGNIQQKLYYDNSEIVKRLRILPYIEILVVAIFIFMGYIGFNYSKRIEQSHVWVGLAKEAAHQLGTPLSSLLAWIEIIRMDTSDSRRVLETLDEMQHDVDHLNKIAQRFSKIGSRPEMKNEDIGKLMEKVCLYFERRLPHLGKKVEIRRAFAVGILHEINPELFEWVIENLLKNGAESFEAGRGIITVSLEKTKDNIQILVTDNGKGMTPAVKRDAFRPGFTTKKRGWGLGLSLCKRIIEEYHGGKIYIKKTAIGKGTTFAIELKLPVQLDDLV